MTASSSQERKGTQVHLPSLLLRKRVHFQDLITEQSLPVSPHHIYSVRFLKWKEIQKLEKETGISPKKGKFTARETARLREAVVKTLKERNMSMETFKEHISSSSIAGLNLFCQIAQKLTDGRPLITIHRKVTRLYHKYNYKGRFSSEEDAHILRYVSHFGGDWRGLAREIKRTPKNVYSRYESICNDYRTGFWTPEEEKQLEAIVHELQTPGPDGKPKVQKGYGLWVEVSKRLNRSFRSCLAKWCNSIAPKQKNNVTTIPAWNTHSDYVLVKTLYEMGVEDESEVNWQKVAGAEYKDLKHWPYVRCQPRWRVLKQRTLSRLPSLRNKCNVTFDEILEATLKDLEEKLSKENSWKEFGEKLKAKAAATIQETKSNETSCV